MRSTVCLLSLAACSDYSLHSPVEGSAGGERPTHPPMTQAYRVVDSWTLTQTGGVDVLFFGDTSGSMSEELQTLSSEILTFMSRLDYRVGDWQLLAVTGPDGCGIHGVIAAADPEMMVLMPCGFDLARTESEAPAFLARKTIARMRAVREGHVWAADGNAYFNRPGPRLVTSIEILPEILHPEAFNFGHQGASWRQAG